MKRLGLHAGLVLMLAAGAAPAATGPAAADDRLPVARAALERARRMLEQNTRLPREAAFDLGLLQALLGDLDGGVATIRLADDPTGVHGPRWQALFLSARETAGPLGVTAVLTCAERQRGADRAAMLFGLADAVAAAGDAPTFLVTVSSASEQFPAVGANLLLDVAEADRAAGRVVPPELLSRAYELARAVPPDARTPDGGSEQAATLGRLALWQAASGNDSAALQAAEAITDVNARQAPLLALLEAQAAAGRFAAALDTAAKLATETADPATGANWQAVGLLRLARTQKAAGDATGARSVARRAVEAAQRSVDSYLRVMSLLAAAEALQVAGDSGVAGLVGEAMASLANAPHRQRAALLLGAGRVYALAGSGELAAVSFKSGREVAALAGDDASLRAAVTVPASVGYTAEANAGLELVAGDPVRRRAHRILLAKTYAANGLRQDGIAAARGMPTEAPEDRRALADALSAVVRTAPADSNAELLREALDAVDDPLDLPAVQQLAATAVDVGLPAVAVDCYAAVLAAGARANTPEERLGLDVLLGHLTRAITSGTGGSLTALAGAAEAAANTTRDALRRSAALATLGSALAKAGERAGADRLLTASAAAVQQVAPEEMRVVALAELAAACAGAGNPTLADASFGSAEAVLNSLPKVPPRVLLALAECQATAGRRGAERYLVRALMAAPNLDKEGSTDLQALARVATICGLPADASAIIDRIYRPEEQLVALLDVARAILGRPLKPLRQPAGFGPVVNVPAPPG